MCIHKTKKSRKPLQIEACGKCTTIPTQSWKIISPISCELYFAKTTLYMCIISIIFFYLSFCGQFAVIMKFNFFIEILITFFSFTSRFFGQFQYMFFFIIIIPFFTWRREKNAWRLCNNAPALPSARYWKQIAESLPD